MFTGLRVLKKHNLFVCRVFRFRELKIAFQAEYRMSDQSKT